MAFTIRKFSNHGTTNPIVAVLGVQTNELLQWLDVEKSQKAEIQNCYFEIRRRLLNCEDIFRRMLSARDAALENCHDTGDRRVAAVPFVVDLQNEVEALLYAAKLTVREIAKLLNALFREEFKEEASIFWEPNGRQSAAAAWSLGRFGDEHPLSIALSTESDWIGEVIRKRNALEHPGGKSGTLVVNNFELLPEGVFEPSWERTGENAAPKADLYRDVEVILQNFLTLAEHLLLTAIDEKTTFSGIYFVAIPEDDRNPNCPVRIRVAMDPEKLAPITG